MFTGLIETIGAVERLRRSGSGARLEVRVEWPDRETPASGDSVAVDGACLTVLEPESEGFVAEVSPETLARTLLDELRPGTPVNLERALRLGDRLGGHLVLGHVDEVVRLVAARDEGHFSRWRVALPDELAGEVAHKGSVALHGVSLTVASLGDGWFEVALIPETLRATVLGSLGPGARLHLETDVLAKYVASAVAARRRRSAIDQLFGSGGDDATH